MNWRLKFCAVLRLDNLLIINKLCQELKFAAVLLRRGRA